MSVTRTVLRGVSLVCVCVCGARGSSSLYPRAKERYTAAILLKVFTVHSLANFRWRGGVVIPTLVIAIPTTIITAHGRSVHSC